MNKNEYTIPVSEFAKLCNTTRDTLRHYYETGILVPYVNPENGYHYYATSQVSSFYFINCFRQTGCSIKELSSLIHNTESANVHRMLTKQIVNLKNELYVVKQQLNSLSILLKMHSYHENGLNEVPCCYDIPKISVIKTPIRNKEEATSISIVAEDIRKHVEYISTNTQMPPYPLGATITLEDLRDKRYVYNDIITLTAAKAIRKNLIPLPSTKVVGCFHENPQKNIQDSYQDILDYIDANGLKPLSDLFSISIFNIYKNTEDHSYLKALFICVE